MHAARERKNRHHDQRNDSRAHALEGRVHDRIVTDVGEHQGDCEDDDERRQDAAQQCRDGTFETPHLVADEYRGIDGDRSGNRLREGQQVQEFLVLDPSALVDQLAARWKLSELPIKTAQ